MVNTTKIRTVIEPYVRNWLSTRFPRHIFREKLVQLTTGHGYSFDAVAEDGSIVGAILCNRPSTRTGRENTGAIRKASWDLNYLKLLPADVKKLMVFTDARFCELVCHRAARLGTESIEMIVCELPADLKELLEQILNQASNEQRVAE